MCACSATWSRTKGWPMADALHASILIKGGHSDGEVLADSLFNPDGSSQSFKSERIDTRNLHGTGCTLSSAIAAFLLKGLDIPSASLNCSTRVLSETESVAPLLPV